MKFMKDMKGQRNGRLRKLARNFTQKGKTRGAQEHASFNPLHELQVLVGSKVMRIIHECPVGQGSGSASPKGCARALAPSQSYRFVNNSHDHPAHGRRPQIFPEKSPNLCQAGRAKNLRASGQRPGGAADEIISCSEPALAEFIMKQRSSAASWLKLKQLTEPSDRIIASSPLQDRVKP